MSYFFDSQDKESLLNLPFLGSLKNKNILVTGANGLIGSTLIDGLMIIDGVTIIALSRNREKTQKRFANYLNSSRFSLLIQDVCDPIIWQEDIHYIIHAASPSHPIAYSQSPVDVIKANLLGTLNALKLAHEKKARLLYVSSGEVYGESSLEDGGMDENYLGLLNFLDIRSCYPESKRASENLCICYKEQYGVDIVIARPGHIYGAGITEDNSRADAQFLRNVINNKNIVLKSAGEQKRSYCYITDCVSALLYILLLGKNGEAYNIANKNSIVTIKEYAQTLAELGNVSVLFDLPSFTEKRGYSKNPDAVLNAAKLEELGWNAVVEIKEGLSRTLRGALNCRLEE